MSAPSGVPMSSVSDRFPRLHARKYAERSGKAREVRRSPTAGFVALAGALEFNDLGAEVGEQLAAERSGEDAGGVQHADAVQRG